MKTVRLNLEDRQSWQKFQHVLTSFASDYIDLVAAEQTAFKFEQQNLSLAFTLIAVPPDQERANYFTRNLESFLKRLQLVGVRQIELDFFAIGESVPTLNHKFEVTFIPPTPDDSAIASPSTVQLAPAAKGGGLFRALRSALTSPELAQNLRSTGKLAARDPKRLLIGAKDAIVLKGSEALAWVDTFPWETWFQAKLEWQKRRHKRNLVKAIIEDVIFGLFLIAALWLATDFLSGPTLNLAQIPAQHYDSRFANPKYRCGNPGISMKNYVCLTHGMSYAQVTSILGGDGKPLGISRPFSNSTVLASWQKGDDVQNLVNNQNLAVVISWQSGDVSMNATFRNDKLVAKAINKYSS
ncbi:hypothetical protein [Pseudanabaena sp. PCC 6802]|uniref:hypothetical protein n=1 Tax=Pseudanabaena sp. PCC 6802 TaxID=118173 RepID=UPI000348C867|nr:hypothetical protein [Pseudanabaena sp. PCC 6802]